MATRKKEKLSARERVLARACAVANEDPEVRAIEKEFDAITDNKAISPSQLRAVEDGVRAILEL